MKTYKKILVAFILNIAFSIFELVGGILTNSVSIISDSVHDFGDAISIGISLILEKISKRKPDSNYTYGYARYSILGALITTIVLTVGSIFVIINSINRIINPEPINYNGMILFAIFGVVINFMAAYFTRDGKSINQKAVNLHMLEDVLGWVVVLIGSILMRFTNIVLLDALMSISIAVYILVNAFKHIQYILDLFLEKTPKDISISELKKHIMSIEGIEDVHHIHVWSMDGITNYATMHVVTKNKNTKEIKDKIREEMQEHNIIHTTIEIEENLNDCNDKECNVKVNNEVHLHHHH